MHEGGPEDLAVRLKIGGWCGGTMEGGGAEMRGPATGGGHRRPSVASEKVGYEYLDIDGIFLC